MSLCKRTSVSKLQSEINKELANLQIKRNFSLTTLPSQSSLRSSFSKSVKSIFFDEGSHNRKNLSFKDKSPSPKFLTKEPKLGRSQDVVGIKNAKSHVGKLKKKTTQGMTRSFAQLSRKNSQPTQASSIVSSCQSFTENDYNQLVQKNKQNEQKIQQQKFLIVKLESIIQQLTN